MSSSPNSAAEQAIAGLARADHDRGCPRPRSRRDGDRGSGQEQPHESLRAVTQSGTHKYVQTGLHTNDPAEKPRLAGLLLCLASPPEPARGDGAPVTVRPFAT